MEDLLRWKQAKFSLDRPKGGRHRHVTSKRLKQSFCALLGFVVRERPDLEITSVADLVRREIVGGFAEWSMNERRVAGDSLLRNFRLLFAALSQHPSFNSLDLSWTKRFLGSLPTEPKSELKKRKAEKFLPHKVIQSIPAKIRAGRQAASKKDVPHVARLAMEELLMLWFCILPWRQRNVRECRIGGPTPNLFKGRAGTSTVLEMPPRTQGRSAESASACPLAEQGSGRCGPS